MGAYLSAPVTEKLSSDESNEKRGISYGASSMQGWRMTQEDAHNTILEFDEDASLFAVYDGHGGHEVATYCALNLPDFLKDTEAYKNGDWALALEQAYLGFDALLTEPSVIKQLKIIAGDKKKDEVDEDDEDPEEVSHLYEEATMSIEDLVQRYKAQHLPHAKALRDTSSAKPASPFLRAKLSSTDSGASSSKLDMADEPTTTASTGEDQQTNGEANKPETATEEVQSSSKVTEKNGSDHVEDQAANGKDSSPEKPVIESNGLVIEPVVSFKGKGKGKGKSNLVKRNVHLTPEEAAKIKSEEERLTKMTERKQSLRAQTGDQLYQRLATKDCENEDDTEEDDDDKEDEDFVSSDDENSDDYEDLDDDDEDQDSEDEDELDGETDFTMNMKEEPGSDSGCTAVMALLNGLNLFVANAGDSRAVLCRGGVAKAMSFDHKPEDEPESSRIVKAGGQVTADGRVNGGLNLSRALGDHAYKQNKDLPPQEQMISAMPDIEKVVLQPEEDEFLVIACDGIWNSMTNQQVVDFIRPRLQSGPAKISQICEEIFDACLSEDTMGDGSGCDNMTAIIIRFDWKGDQLKAEPGSATVSSKRPLSPGNSPSTATPTQKSSADGSNSSSDSSKRLKLEEPEKQP